MGKHHKIEKILKILKRIKMKTISLHICFIIITILTIVGSSEQGVSEENSDLVGNMTRPVNKKLYNQVKELMERYVLMEKNRRFLCMWRHCYMSTESLNRIAEIRKKISNLIEILRAHPNLIYE